MPNYEIDLKVLRSAVNTVLDHLIKDLELKKVMIEKDNDFYWHCPVAELFDMSQTPIGLDVGRLSDDVDFMQLIQQGRGGDIAYTLVHVAPLLRYIGETIER